jgi:hypothetical protein
VELKTLREVEIERRVAAGDRRGADVDHRGRLDRHELLFLRARREPHQQRNGGGGGERGPG